MLSPLPKRLESSGLLRRERRPEDERSVAIRLSDAGARLRDRARTVPLAIGDAMGLTPEQVTEAERHLRLLTATCPTAEAAAAGNHPPPRALKAL
ncbi:hypothetical protein [Streptomyces sp. NPDC003710]